MDEQAYKKVELKNIRDLSNEKLFNAVFYMVNGMNFDGEPPDYVPVFPYPYWLYEELKKELKKRLEIF